MSTTADYKVDVIVRVRPQNPSKNATPQFAPTIKITDEKTMVFDPLGPVQRRGSHPKNMEMKFDRVYNMEDNTYQIFQEWTTQMVDHVIAGYNCLIFAYGATGTGKSFTLLGNHTSPGLVYLTMSHLFSKLETYTKRMEFTAKLTCIEIYNDIVKDLLHKDKSLKIQERNKELYIKGLVPIEVSNIHELRKMLAKGAANRLQSDNEGICASSRSHAIFELSVELQDQRRDVKYAAKLSMTDLAGSERANTTGNRAKSAVCHFDPSINRALLTLASCLTKLNEGEKNIPFRDSNLTRLLKDSLLENCKTLFIANVCASSQAYENTYNTLMYAQRIKKLNAIPPGLSDTRSLHKQPTWCLVKQLKTLMLTNERLQQRNKLLVEQVEVLQQRILGNVDMRSSSCASSVDSLSSGCASSNTLLGKWYQRIDRIYDAVVGSHEYITEIQRRMKALDLRRVLHQKTEMYKNMLLIPNVPAEEKDFANFASSISHIVTQIELLNDEMIGWRNKAYELFNRMERLRKDMENSKYSDQLRIYVHSKDLEMSCAKKIKGIKTPSLIDMTIMRDLEQLRQAFFVARETLEHFYDRLMEKQTLSIELQQSFEEMQRILRRKCGMLKNIKSGATCKESLSLGHKPTTSTSTLASTSTKIFPKGTESTELEFGLQEITKGT